MTEKELRKLNKTDLLEILLQPLFFVKNGYN